MWLVYFFAQWAAEINGHKRTGLAAVLVFIFVSPDRKPNRINNVEDKYKS
jgi:hypothetical protein